MSIIVIVLKSIIILDYNSEFKLSYSNIIEYRMNCGIKSMY